MSHHINLVHTLAGSPEPYGAVAAHIKDEPGFCRVTGEWCERTAPADKALGANFTDQTMYSRPDSTRVGVPAIWACSGKGNQTIRLWSVVAAPGVTLPASQPKAWLQNTPGLCLTNRANTAPVANMLTNPPPGEWVVSIAVSSQKHVLPYATTNHGDGPWTVRMENTDVTSTPTVFRAVITHAAHLRGLGHHSEKVLAGIPDMSRIKTPEDLTAWKTHADPLGPYTGSAVLELALWCLTKEGITQWS